MTLPRASPYWLINFVLIQVVLSRVWVYQLVDFAFSQKKSKKYSAWLSQAVHEILYKELHVIYATPHVLSSASMFAQHHFVLISPILNTPLVILVRLILATHIPSASLSQH